MLLKSEIRENLAVRGFSLTWEMLIMKEQHLLAEEFPEIVHWIESTSEICCWVGRVQGKVYLAWENCTLRGPIGLARVILGEGKIEVILGGN